MMHHFYRIWLSLLLITSISCIPNTPGVAAKEVERGCQAFAAFVYISLNDVNNACTVSDDNKCEIEKLGFMLLYAMYLDQCNYRKQQIIDEHSWIWLLP